MYDYLRKNFKQEYSAKNLRAGYMKVVNIVLRVQHPSQFKRLRRVDFYTRRKTDKKSLITIFGILKRVRCSRNGKLTSIILIHRQKNFGAIYNFITNSQNFLSLGNWDMRDEGIDQYSIQGRKNNSDPLTPKPFSRFFFDRNIY